RLAASAGPVRRAGATRGRGRLRPVHRLRRAQDTRARLPDLGDQPGPPSGGRAPPRAQHPQPERSPRVGRRQGGPGMTVIRGLERAADRSGRRDLTLAAVIVIGLSRLIEPPGVWLVGIFLLGAMLLGTLQVLGEERVREDDDTLG